MNEEAQIATWLTTVLDFLKAVLPVVVPTFAGYIIARYNMQNSRHLSILEEQLQKVFSPIQLIYRLENYKDQQTQSTIASILKENFLLVPTPFIDAWKSRKVTIIDFLSFNEACFEYARKKLGYQHRQIDKEEKKAKAKWDRKARHTLSGKTTLIRGAFPLICVLILYAIMYIMSSVASIHYSVISNQAFDSSAEHAVAGLYALAFLFVVVIGIPVWMVMKIDRPKKR